jgi:hypothetical protein
MPESTTVRPPDPTEREKWEMDVELRKQELAIKDQEQETKRRELDLRERGEKRSRWTNPLSLAVLAGVLALFGNFVNGLTQQQIERSKAEASRILEMIKTNDPDKAAGCSERSRGFAAEGFRATEPP